MIRIGLIDGALPPDWPELSGQFWCCEPDGLPLAQEHAIAMARTFEACAGQFALVNAVVFPGRLSASLDDVCTALDRLIQDPPDIVLCSFGIARSSVELSVATERLLQAGSLVVASAPARGDPVYPAAFDGVVSVQGDARCMPGELSRLDLPQAMFGACPVAAGNAHIRGASAAAAHLAGLLATVPNTTQQPDFSGLMPFVKYVGRERKTREVHSA
ncbi:hypothetical protein [Roseibium sp.]|uniref:hypothetical protein n=1 Tax=Roseibium sp. TaxID=1936156 RepID=UPI003D0F6F89